MHFDSRTENAEAVVGVSMGSEPGCIFFSRRGPRKAAAFPWEMARALESEGDGVFVQLPRRALYVFFGFARYHLKHGVPWCGPAGACGPEPYDRLTVTMRSVPVTPLRSNAGAAAEETSRAESLSREEKRQRTLAGSLARFMSTGARGVPKEAGSGVGALPIQQICTAAFSKRLRGAGTSDVLGEKGQCCGLAEGVAHPQADVEDLQTDVLQAPDLGIKTGGERQERLPAFHRSALRLCIDLASTPSDD